MSHQSPPAAGWYPDNLTPGQVRFWDGAQWTDRTAPVRGGIPIPPPLGPTSGAPGQPRVMPPSAPTFGVPSHPVAPRRAEAGRAGTAQPSWLARHKVLVGVVAGLLLLVPALAVAGTAASPSGDSTSVGEPAPDVAGGAGDDESASAVEAEAPPVDTDGDGVADEDDYAPRNANVATEDDVDTDGDGVADYLDDFPDDPAFSKDSDGDGVADRLDAFPDDPDFSRDSDGDGVADSLDGFPTDPSRSEITLAMENAQGSAENYLDVMPFSRQGLIDQLSSEYGDGYDVADATWAVDQVDADWNAEAVEAARNYLDIMSFSRQGLIDQLSSAYGDQYTVEQATYAVDQIGL